MCEFIVRRCLSIPHTRSHSRGSYPSLLPRLSNSVLRPCPGINSGWLSPKIKANAKTENKKKRVTRLQLHIGSRGKPRGKSSMPWRWPMVRLIVLRATEWTATVSCFPSWSSFLFVCQLDLVLVTGLTFPCRIPNTRGTDYQNAAR